MHDVIEAEATTPARSSLSNSAQEARAEMDRLRNEAAAHPDSVEAWNSLGTTLAGYGALEESAQAFELVAGIARESGRWEELAQAVGGLAWVQHMRMNLDAAEGHYLDAIRICTENHLDPSLQAQWCGRLGYLYESLDELDRAEVVYKQALALAEQAESADQRARLLGDLSDVYRSRGNEEKATEALLQARELEGQGAGEEDPEDDDTERRVIRDMALCEALGHREKMGFNYFSYGVMHELQGDLLRAEDMYLAALEVYASVGNLHGMAELSAHIGGHAYLRGEFERASEMYSRALDLETSLDRNWGMARACRGMGMVCQGEQRWEEARDLYERALTLVGTDGPRNRVAALCGDLAVVYKELGDGRKAEAMYRNALEVGEGVSAWEVAARAAAGLGIMYLETSPQGDAAARPMLLRGLSLYRRAGDARMIDKLERLLEMLDSGGEP
ncbi:MAG: tetratricopeptide repeat protein [Nitrospirota bacterium]|nr:tetratricopeptide repeat protein [Nitrospirota bacterium]